MTNKQRILMAASLACSIAGLSICGIAVFSMFSSPASHYKECQNKFDAFLWAEPDDIAWTLELEPMDKSTEDAILLCSSCDDISYDYEGNPKVPSDADIWRIYAVRDSCIARRSVAVRIYGAIDGHYLGRGWAYVGGLSKEEAARRITNTKISILNVFSLRVVQECKDAAILDSLESFVAQLENE